MAVNARRVALAGVLLGAAAAACSPALARSGGSPSGDSVTAAIPGAPEVRVVAGNFSFTPKEIRLPAGTDVNLTFTNPRSTRVEHDISVPALGIRILQDSGGTKTIGLRGLPPGRYQADCTIPGHAQAGMRGTVVVQ